jgi:uncharacterized heparinase superfamily protein
LGLPPVTRVLLYARTARRLRWRQWVYRPVRRLQSRFPAPPLAGPAPAVDPARAAAMASALAAAGPGDAAARRARADAVLAGRFAFLGHEERLDAVDWTSRRVSHLWSYNLHYFDYAVDLAWAFRLTGDAAYARRFEALAGGWIAATAGGRGDGWEPYPVSLRIVNWTYARLLFGDALGAFAAELDASLARQIGFLEQRLEWHVLANHLQKNLHALAVGSLLFAGAESERRRERALSLLWRELSEQVLRDGGHFERSPMYHAIALADFLELLLLLDACGLAAPAHAVERVRRMAHAWACLSRPDGEPHLFNDAAEGIAPPPAWLDALAERVLGAAPRRPEGAWALPDTGYFGWADAGDRIVVDCGVPGPGYQPGHAHCDLLSFELDLGGRRVAVDAGVHGYDGDPFREYVRSTRAHNTVSVDGGEQSEVWGTFRVAGMARPLAGRAETTADGGWRMEGGCVPFHDARVEHRREVRMAEGECTVTDRVAGADGRRVTSYLHLHPSLEAAVRGARVEVRDGAFAVTVEPFGFDRIDVVRGAEAPRQGWHCPRFGAALPACAVVMEAERHDGRPLGYRIRREAA